MLETPQVIVELLPLWLMAVVVVGAILRTFPCKASKDLLM
jgi:hypothetical protein